MPLPDDLFQPSPEIDAQMPCPFCDAEGRCGATMDDGTVLLVDCPECGASGWL